MKRFVFLAAIVALSLAVPAGAAGQDPQGSDDAGSRWPLLLDTDRGDIVLYQPQVDSFDGTLLEARAALSFTRKGGSAPVFGAVWLRARMATDMDTRMVSLVSLTVTDAKFPDASDEQIANLKEYLAGELPKWDFDVSLDLLLASAGDAKLTGATGFQNDPPEIIFREAPAVLVLIEGEPMMSKLADYDMQYVANTAFFIVQQKGLFYLYGDAMWFSAQDIMGPWSLTTDLPPDVRTVSGRIAEDEKRRQEAEGEAQTETASGGGEPDAGEAAGGSTGDGDGRPDTRIPEIIVRKRPAELIFTDGKPAFVPIQGTQLLYMQNTESDVIMDIAGQRYYVLLSGRWYTATDMIGGVWAFVEPDRLPADFAKIPEDSDMGNVLPSVAGTQQAKEAVLANTVPQTAEIDRATATVEVTYDGNPEFETCSDNGVSYAVNTDKSVLLIDNTYYCCDQAVWFVSGGPTGPWKVADAVPEAVADIPPECPVYNVKYVYIYDATPEVVYVGYTPAYLNSYVYGGVVVYGTGRWYYPWWGTYYYPRAATWGFHAHYNPWTGWGFTVGVSYGWMHVGVGWGRPWPGGWWGPAGYRYGYRYGYGHGYAHGYRHGYHHGAAHGYAAGYRAGQRQTSNNLYRERRSGVKATGGAEVARNRQGQTAKKQPRKAQGEKNNVYADRNGDTYRQEGRDLKKRDNKTNTWSKAQQTSPGRIDKEAQRRYRSNEQTRKYDRQRREYDGHRTDYKRARRR